MGFTVADNFSYIRAMKQIGEETHTVVLDLFSYSVGLFEAIGRDNIHKYTSIKVGVNNGVWPDDFIKELNKPDTVSENTHFNKYGAWLLTKGLVKLINECEDKQIQGLKNVIKDSAFAVKSPVMCVSNELCQTKE